MNTPNPTNIYSRIAFLKQVPHHPRANQSKEIGRVVTYILHRRTQNAKINIHRYGVWNILTYRWNPQCVRPPIGIYCIEGPGEFVHSLFRRGWLWVGDNHYLLWDYLCFALWLEYFLSLPWGPSTSVDFLFMSKISFEGQKQTLKKNSCRFKTWMGFVGQILMKLFEVFFSCPLISSWR